MCAGHFADMVKENPLPDSDDPAVLFEWSVYLHNLVNDRIGKPILTVGQAMERWTTRSIPEPPPSQFDLKIVIILALLVALIFMFLYR